jgi:hypothetical protein
MYEDGIAFQHEEVLSIFCLVVTDRPCWTFDGLEETDQGWAVGWARMDWG